MPCTATVPHSHILPLHACHMRRYNRYLLAVVDKHNGEGHGEGQYANGEEETPDGLFLESPKRNLKNKIAPLPGPNSFAAYVARRHEEQQKVSFRAFWHPQTLKPKAGEDPACPDILKPPACPTSALPLPSVCGQPHMPCGPPPPRPVLLSCVLCPFSLSVSHQHTSVFAATRNAHAGPTCLHRRRRQARLHLLPTCSARCRQWEAHSFPSYSSSRPPSCCAPAARRRPRASPCPLAQCRLSAACHSCRRRPRSQRMR